MYEDCSKPIVNVLWDAASDIEGCEEKTQSDQILMPSKWNRDVEGAWRMDVDIAVNNVVEEASENGLEAGNSKTDYGDSDWTSDISDTLISLNSE